MFDFTAQFSYPSSPAYLVPGILPFETPTHLLPKHFLISIKINDCCVKQPYYAIRATSEMIARGKRASANFIDSPDMHHQL